MIIDEVSFVNIFQYDFRVFSVWKKKKKKTYMSHTEKKNTEIIVSRFKIFLKALKSHQSEVDDMEVISN